MARLLQDTQLARVQVQRGRDWLRVAGTIAIQGRDTHQEQIEVSTWGSPYRSFIGGLRETRWILTVSLALLPVLLRADQLYVADTTERDRWFGFVLEATPDHVTVIQTRTLPAFVPPKWGAPRSGRGRVTHLGYWEDIP